MKIAACSDIHWQRHYLTKLPRADILIVAGDFCTRGELLDFEKFVSWLGKYPAKHKVVVPGNHDMPLARFPGKTKEMLTEKGIKLLINEAAKIGGLKIYGCPYSEWLPGWSFMLSDNELKEIYDQIPEGLDILIMHNCPKRESAVSDAQGSRLTLELLKRAKPKIFIGGHWHGLAGHWKCGETDVYNVSILDDNYEYVRGITEISF